MLEVFTEKILEGTAVASPFDKVCGRDVVKFDRIVFDTRTHRIAFEFAGKEVFFFQPEVYQEGIIIINILGVEGRMACSFTN